MARRRRGEVERGSCTALVTGAAKGIGRCYADRLASLGYDIVAVDVDAAVEQAAAEISRCYGVRCTSRICDMARLEAAEDLFAWTCGEGIAVDVLVNNAGIFSFLDVLSTPVERIRRIVLLHDMTTTTMCRLYGEEMARRGGGRILNMSSYSIWMPFPGLSLYSASKAYLKSFSVAFSKEVRERGVSVTAVCPAGIATDLYGLSPRWQKIGLRLGILSSADSCARRGLRAMWKGRRCVVPDWWFRLFIPICQCMPRPLLGWLRRYTMKFQK